MLNYEEGFADTVKLEMTGYICIKLNTFQMGLLMLNGTADLSVGKEREGERKTHKRDDFFFCTETQGCRVKTWVSVLISH